MTFSKNIVTFEESDNPALLAINTHSQMDDNFDEAREILASHSVTLEVALEQLKRAKAHSQSGK